MYLNIHPVHDIIRMTRNLPNDTKTKKFDYILRAIYPKDKQDLKQFPVIIF